MNFTDNKPIYRQIVDFAFNEVTTGHWAPGERIPSVRELSAELGVNSRTVLKAFEDLQDLGLIAPQRGMGFFLAADARQRVTDERRLLLRDHGAGHRRRNAGARHHRRRTRPPYQPTLFIGFL